MANGKYDPTRENDYIEQLQWRSRHGRWVPVHFEPKWKYKIVYRYPLTTLFDGIMRVVMLIGLVSAVIFLISSDMLTLEARIFFCSVFGLIFTIVFFAVRDASKDSSADSEHLD